MDSGVDPTLAVAFPLPYQIFALVGLAILAWATNLHGLDRTGIDVAASLDLRTDGAPALPITPLTPGARHTSALVVLYRSVYNIFITYATIYSISWTAYRYTTHGEAKLADAFGYIPGLTALALICALVCPYNILHKTERRKFLHALHRCLFPTKDSPIYFCDVILADIFTSFSQVIGDVWLSLCMLLPGHSVLLPTAGRGWVRWILPTIMSLPYFIRFRQCLIEYNSTKGTNNRSLYNAIKYATAFPTLFLSAAQKAVEHQSEAAAVSYWRSIFFYLWVLSAAVNSLYSFWWDVTNDWGLDTLNFAPEDSPFSGPLRRHLMLRTESSTPLLRRRATTDLQSSSPNGLHPPDRIPRRLHLDHLRPRLTFPTVVYLLLMVVNFGLRLTWSFQLLNVLNVKSHAGLASFSLKFSEIFRRWLWVFIRVEWEMIKKTNDVYSRAHASPSEASAYELLPTPSAERSPKRSGEYFDWCVSLFIL